MKRKLFMLLWSLACLTLQAQITNDSIWLDSMLRTMTPQEKIGQLFIIRAYANDQENHIQSVLQQIRDHQVGGICYFKGTSKLLQERMRQYSEVSKIPLLNSMDAEWGAGMRLTDVSKYPKHLCLGALTNNRLIYHMAKTMAMQLRELGIHMNFAPVADVNNNLQNPVINERSFGSDRLRVTTKSFAFLQGLQDGGVLACLKHFPGHGDTDVDSHNELPELPFDRNRLDSIELFPYQALLSRGPAAVMVGHLHIPALDSGVHIPATLSPGITQYLLRDSLNYRGLIVTDALEMEGVAKNFTDGEIAVKAMLAGNDLLLLSKNIEQAKLAIEQSIGDGILSWERIHQSVRRILLAKRQLGLFDQVLDTVQALDIDRMNRTIKAINEPIYRASFCLGRDPQQLVPIRNIPKNVLTIQLGNGNSLPFLSRFTDYTNVRSLFLQDTSDWTSHFDTAIREADLIVIHVHGLHFKANKFYGMNLYALQKLNPVIRDKACIVVLFGCPYVSMYFPTHTSLLLAHEENELTQDLAAQMLVGTDPLQGVSPVTVTNVLKAGQGVFRPSLMRMGYSLPEAQGMSSDTLAYIDTIAAELIKQKAAPGCQIAVVRNNKMIYQKSFGFLDYDSTSAVTHESLYDLASLTKILCTAPLLFQLEDRELLSFSKKFSDYLPLFKNSNKSQLSFRDFMLHQGRLLSWIPYYKNTALQIDSVHRYHPLYYDTVASLRYNVPVAAGMYLRSDYPDSIFQQIVESRTLEEKKVNYSDLGFYFIPKLVHQLTGKTMERYYQQEVVEPLELKHTVFNPLTKGFVAEQIAPTEVDTYWRKQVIRGYVHDMGAAMMGGVSGHAGLFSNAGDVARIMQLYLNHGQYKGLEILQSSSLGTYFVRDREFLRRSLLFDMPALQDTIRPYVSSKASNRTIGHQGFTGTCAWIDPEAQINYVFLSNRSFPSAEHNLLHRERYRTKIQDVIYRSLQNGGQLERSRFHHTSYSIK